MNTIKSKVKNFIKKWLNPLTLEGALVYLSVVNIGINVLAYWLHWEGWFAENTPINEIIRNNMLILGGIWAFYGIMLAARRIKLQERGIEIQERRQVAERFARAAEQLDSKSDSVRMVAILALQKVANEADEKTFQDVVKTLCSYVRENRPIKERSKDTQDTPSKFPEYLQQIIDFLSEIDNTKRLDENNNPKIDLSATDLRGAPWIYGKNLSKFNLNKANLKEVELWNSILKRVYLSGADLERVNLSIADLKEANLSGANLKEANLFGADLKEANLRGANLEMAGLVGVNLEMADLKEANFTSVNTTNIKGLESTNNIETVLSPTTEISAEIKRRKQKKSN